MNFLNLFAGFLFSSIGFVAFIYGKRMVSTKPLVLGLVLMIYPYFGLSTLWIYLIGSVLTLALFLFNE